jgi:shikimate dehydrogenase
VGISVTSPYKKYFLEDVELSQNAKFLGSINCIGLKGDRIAGENTDYLAILEILKNWISTFRDLSVVVLGDGVMSTVTKFALNNLNLEYKILSRRNVDGFTQLNLSKIFESDFSKNAQKIIINTCSREYVFAGTLPQDAIFWDYNYNFIPHSSVIPSKVKFYCDGMQMLELQARHSLAFWSIKSN